MNAVVLETGKHDRVDFHALEAPDITFYLPVEDLVLGADSWVSLDKEWKALSTGRPPFKEWLYDAKDARISVRTLRSAAQSMDHIPETFLQLLEMLSR